MTLLWILWAYLIVGIVVSKIYGKKLVIDVRSGHPKAQRLFRLQAEIGSDKFWSLFYILTTMMYGLFFVHAVVLMIRGSGNAELH